MLTIIVCIVIVLIAVYYFSRIFEEEKKIEVLLTSSDIIPLTVVMAFSTTELIERIKCYYRKKGKRLKIEYSDGKYIEFHTSCSKEYLINLLDNKQDFIISKRYKPDDEYFVKDDIDKIMYDIWLDYAYRDNYKKIFWREMYNKLSRGEVSNSTYSEIYRRFYRYKYMNQQNNY